MSITNNPEIKTALFTCEIEDLSQSLNEVAEMARKFPFDYEIDITDFIDADSGTVAWFFSSHELSDEKIGEAVREILNN